MQISPLVFKPDSYFRLSWDASIFLIIIYLTISLPVRIAFQVITTDFLYYLDFIMDSIFIVDIALNFNTGIDDIGGKIIMDRKKIFLDYLKLWFWIDLVSSAPYSWFIAWSY